MPKGDRKLSLKAGSEIVLVVSEDDRIVVERAENSPLKLRVVIVKKGASLKRGIIGRSGVLFILAANLPGNQQQELISRAINRCYAIFISHTHQDFDHIFRTNLMHALNKTGQLKITFNPVEKPVHLEHGFMQFAPPNLAGQGRASEYGHRNGLPDGERGIGSLMEDLVALDDYHLPSLLIVEKYRQQINKSFDLGTDLTMAAAWRAKRGIVLPVKRDLALYELILYLLKEKQLIAMSHEAVAEQLYVEVRRFYQNRRNTRRFKNSIARMVGIAYQHHPELRMKLAA